MQELKQAGLKITAPRVTILEFLQNTDKNHFTAEQVYDAIRKAGSEVGLATVYRVLSQFEHAGLLSKNSFDGNQAVYELADDAHHDHLICLRCGKIVEFYDEKLEALQETIAKKNGFALENHELTLYGCCATCLDE